jgi:uncharacterized protein (DUF2235 family)
MTGSGRNLIVLSDGTGNSAAAASKTNVWRLYQALDVTDGTQIAAFSDGVGTSNIKPLRILGQALGFGVQLNVLPSTSSYAATTFRAIKSGRLASAAAPSRSGCWSD